MHVIYKIGKVMYKDLTLADISSRHKEQSKAIFSLKTYSPSFSARLLQSKSLRYATNGSILIVAGVSSSDFVSASLPLSRSLGNDCFSGWISSW